jgi:hypothetical protein
MRQLSSLILVRRNFCFLVVELPHVQHSHKVEHLDATQPAQPAHSPSPSLTLWTIGAYRPLRPASAGGADQCSFINGVKREKSVRNSAVLLVQRMDGHEARGPKDGRSTNY